MKKVLVFFCIFGLCGSGYGEGKVKVKLSEEIRKAYEIKKYEHFRVAIFRYLLEKKEETGNRVAAVMLRGMDVCAETVEKEDRIGAGVLFRDGSLLVYFVKVVDYEGLLKKELTISDYLNRIEIKRYVNLKEAQEIWEQVK